MPSLLDRFSALFQRNRPEPQVLSAAPDDGPRLRREPLDFATLLAGDNERRAVVKQCRDMYKKDTRAKGVIQALARDMVRGGFTVTANGPRGREAEQLAERLTQRLDTEHKLDDWVRLALRDGDLYLEVGVAADGRIVAVTRKPTLQMRRNSDDTDRFPEPAQAFWSGPEHWFGVEPPADATWYAEWQIIHARWDHDEDSRYGAPLFASATAAYKRIREGETDIAVRRKTRAGIKYNHKFPEGTTEDQIEAYKEINRDNLDDPTAAIADYFGTADIVTVQGDGAALEAIGDVMHHVRTWWVASPLPMSLLGYGQDLNRDVLQEQKDQYDRALETLNGWVEAEIVRPLLEREWLLAGILPETLQYEIKWKTREALKVDVVLKVATAVKALTDAGLPSVTAWEIAERYLPGVDLTQAKAEMQRRAEQMRQQMSGTQTPAQATAQSGEADHGLRNGQGQGAGQGAREETLVFEALLGEYERAAAALAQLVEYNPYHDGATGQFTSGGAAGTATAADIRLSHHAFQRMQERGKYKSVRETLSKLTATRTPPGDWYVAMARQGKLDGYMVGTDGVVKTVLGPWYDRGKLKGDEVTLAEGLQEATSRPNIRKSLDWQLANLTPALVTTYCEIAELDVMTPAEFRVWWHDWTAAGLESLLIARSEAEDMPDGDA